MGVRISTSTRQLRTSLEPEIKRLGLQYREGTVEYCSQHRLKERVRTICTALRNGEDRYDPTDPLFLKRDAFDHESEYRTLITDPSIESSAVEHGKALRIQPHKLIDSILLDPRAPPELANAFSYYFTKKLGFKKRVGPSVLYKVPQQEVIE